MRIHRKARGPGMANGQAHLTFCNTAAPGCHLFDGPRVLSHGRPYSRRFRHKVTLLIPNNSAAFSILRSISITFSM